ncbi:MAG: hypothetical protein AB1716_13950 [Planctomycetota bacterium]
MDSPQNVSELEQRILAAMKQETDRYVWSPTEVAKAVYGRRLDPTQRREIRRSLKQLAERGLLECVDGEYSLPGMRAKRPTLADLEAKSRAHWAAPLASGCPRRAVGQGGLAVWLAWALWNITAWTGAGRVARLPLVLTCRI